MTGMGFKRDPNKKPYEWKRKTKLKAKKGLRPFSKRAKKNGPIYKKVVDWCRMRLGMRHGGPSGDDRDVMVPCGCCGSPMSLKTAHPHHINGRKTDGPGMLNFMWDPTNLCFVCDLCHEVITNPKSGGADHRDYAIPYHKDYRKDTEDLKASILYILEPAYGFLKYPDSMQAEAICKALVIFHEMDQGEDDDPGEDVPYFDIGEFCPAEPELN